MENYDIRATIQRYLKENNLGPTDIRNILASSKGKFNRNGAYQWLMGHRDIRTDTLGKLLGALGARITFPAQPPRPERPKRKPRSPRKKKDPDNLWRKVATADPWY